MVHGLAARGVWMCRSHNSWQTDAETRRTGPCWHALNDLQSAGTLTSSHLTLLYLALIFCHPHPEGKRGRKETFGSVTVINVHCTTAKTGSMSQETTAPREFRWILELMEMRSYKLNFFIWIMEIMLTDNVTQCSSPIPSGKRHCCWRGVQ